MTSRILGDVFGPIASITCFVNVGSYFVAPFTGLGSPMAEFLFNKCFWSGLVLMMCKKESLLVASRAAGFAQKCSFINGSER